MKVKRHTNTKEEKCADEHERNIRREAEKETNECEKITREE